MRSALITAALVATSALAFKDTSPLLIWSSEADEALSGAQEEVTSGVVAAEEIYGTLSSLGCDWDTLVIAHSEGLHNSKVAALTLPSASADLTIPYLLRPRQEVLDGAIDRWAKICGADVGSDLTVAGEGKNVVNLQISSDQDISALIADLPSPYIFILTGSHKASNPPSKRQETPWPSESEPAGEPSETSPSDDQPSDTPRLGDNGNSTDGLPLLDRVQILTTPIITSLLVVFLLLLPILYVGISALAGIQVPPRMLEIGKATSVGKERKDQ